LGRGKGEKRKLGKKRNRVIGVPTEGNDEKKKKQ